MAKRLIFMFLLTILIGCSIKNKTELYRPHEDCIQELEIKRVGNKFISNLDNKNIDYITIDESFKLTENNYKDPFNNKRTYYIFSNLKGASLTVPKQFGIYKDGATFKNFPNSKTDKFGEYYLLSKKEYNTKMDGAICVKKYKTGEFIHAYFAYHDNVGLGWHNIVISYIEPLPLDFRFEYFKRQTKNNKKFVKDFENRALSSFKILPKD